MLAQELSKEVKQRSADCTTFLTSRMHEVSLIAEAVRIALETAQSAGAAQVRGLRLRVGALSGAVPEAMQFAWDVACQGTIAEGARLEIERVAPVCWCPFCGSEFASDDFFGECPSCRKPSGDLRCGRELEIAAVEMC